ncbi:hypothetical protein [Natrinema salaciae]|uniref:Uncharacterized protein n=1 Tax=Natrinema salaciae TaxID=1186196 RepID=A0A1H9CFH5_9EURY|nr:hypothetical protein [Natrinema salaciae]SEP99966.1 hypothetical protein SAMN04489841_1039 [Natrinema salaciae]
MTDAETGGPTRCPDCGAPIPERDPLTGWWRCDDCGSAFRADGTWVG